MRLPTRVPVLLSLATTAAIVAVAIVAVVAVRTSADRLTEAVVAERAQAAEQAVLSGLGPDSTFHMKQQSYIASNASLPAGAFVLPVSYASETWVYFDPDGIMTGFYSEVRDTETGALLQDSRLSGKTLVITDIASGETRTVANFEWTAGALGSRIDDAASQTRASTESSASSATAERVSMDGRETFIVESAAPGGSGAKRTFIDAATYRTLKWEKVAMQADGQERVTESRTWDAFEVLPGSAMPVVP